MGNLSRSPSPFRCHKLLAPTGRKTLRSPVPSRHDARLYILIAMSWHPLCLSHTIESSAFLLNHVSPFFPECFVALLFPEFSFLPEPRFEIPPLFPYPPLDLDSSSQRFSAHFWPLKGPFPGGSLAQSRLWSGRKVSPVFTPRPPGRTFTLDTVSHP